MRLQNKVAIVTGGSKGIGRETALAFALEGAKVVIADIDADAGVKTMQDIRESGGNALFLQTDVSQPIDVKKMVEETVKQYGFISILFNNAGIAHSMINSMEMSEEEWDKVIDINLKGVFLGTKYAVPEMVKTGGGSIINTASILGLKGQKYLSAYNASKGGVILFTKNAALEYGKDNIRVNAIAPGLIDTDIVGDWKKDQRLWEKISTSNALGREGKPQEVAKGVLFLASDESSYITGSTLSIDGGSLTF
ncbi:SDR family NAD(P)-dependent oxidoreductase [Bacillus spongiae]|uniref:SDR family NAD(P)-dependent oxidoreductase n=1 Tax=Bacillus spongiae TaxID=2683610 RepID=A0ABU8HC69_9BACI